MAEQEVQADNHKKERKKYKTQEEISHKGRIDEDAGKIFFREKKRVVCQPVQQQGRGENEEKFYNAVFEQGEKNRYGVGPEKIVTKGKIDNGKDKHIYEKEKNRRGGIKTAVF
jgi:hypothetical protein